MYYYTVLSLLPSVVSSLGSFGVIFGNRPHHKHHVLLNSYILSDNFKNFKMSFSFNSLKAEEDCQSYSYQHLFLKSKIVLIFIFICIFLSLFYRKQLGST